MTPTADQGRTGTLDYTDPSQTTSSFQEDIPTSIPIELGRFFDELAEGARLSTVGLSTRLQQAVDEHDLQRDELVAAQRDVARLQKAGTLPNPTEYWQRSALPRAAVLVDASMAIVVDEGEQLGTHLDRFMFQLDGLKHPWCNSEPGRSATRTTTSRAIDRLLQSVPSDEAIHALGAWWQRKLRRTATVRALPELLKGGDSDAIIGRTEMALLDGPPWTHGDRLLSAFELAHSEIRTQTELVADGLTTRVARGGRSYLSPSERVTIELRE